MKASVKFPSLWIEQRRLLRTFVDIGPRRLQRRLRYELRQRIDCNLPPRLALALAHGVGPTPAWRLYPHRSIITPPPACASQADSARTICFSFLNEQRQLDWPIPWNDPTWPRLWKFHLHYFDWARQWLDAALASGQWPAEAWALEPLLEQWISANPPGRGDGWHSYTLSLRTRTWIHLFRHSPALATSHLLGSLWEQLCWLQAHPEHCHGGNHWLENLTALAIGGLQFDGSASQAMHRRAMALLRQELPEQLLSDGGHQERSASYHLLMLDRLIELGEFLYASENEQPSWLLQAVESMAKWAATIRLESGGFPRFNDSATDACRPLDAVLASAQRYLAPATIQGHELDLQPQAALINLAETGWSMLRPGQGWELAFKCGVPCPPHLAAHAHSDLLSFDLWYHGLPVLAEVGTSLYGTGPQRQFERSSAAHNTLQLGVPSPMDNHGREVGSTIWIEPVDVWAGFRAGRKAQPHSRSHGHNGPWFWTAGSHDGYRTIDAQHFRWLALRISPSHTPVLVVADAITAVQPLHWRSWWHLGPGLSPSLTELGLRLHTWPVPSSVLLHTTAGYIATGFGQRKPRSTLAGGGSLPAGRHLLLTVLAPYDTPIDAPPSTSKDGSLVLRDLGCLRWRWPAYEDCLPFLAIPQFWFET